jgi:hypothetical protein
MTNKKLLSLGFVDIPKKARDLWITLIFTIMEVEIEQDRIMDGLEKLDRPNNFSRVIDQQRIKKELEEEEIYYKLMADVHLWLIAWGNINRILLKLRKIMSDPKLDWVQERRNKWFSSIRKARNSLEHIDERILKSTNNVPFFENLYLENGHTDGIFIFGTRIKFDDSSLNKITNLKKDLDRWQSKLPTIW